MAYKYSEGESEQLYCPHLFRACGIEGCTAGRVFNCSACDHPDRRIEKVKWSAASIDNK